MEIQSSAGYAMAAQQGLRRQEQGLETIAREATQEQKMAQTVAEAVGVGGGGGSRGQMLDITV